MAFNIPLDIVTKFAEMAAANGKLKRVVFTTEIPIERADQVEFPELEKAAYTMKVLFRRKFLLFRYACTTVSSLESILFMSLPQEAGIAFTNFRHGTVVEGDEDNPYAIVNSTSPLNETFVEKGVLSRVAAEVSLHIYNYFSFLMLRNEFFERHYGQAQLLHLANPISV
jgi:hypothetical protein